MPDPSSGGWRASWPGGCDLAGADELLVSRTVKDLVTGSDIELVDHGCHHLKGVPDEWQLCAVS